MDEKFATDYDVIVVGTGFIESLIAAASARIGKKVLHVDKNGYYGGQWASFSLKNLIEWVENIIPNDNTTEPQNLDLLQDGETTEGISHPNSVYYGVTHKWNVREEAISEEEIDDKRDSPSPLKKEPKIFSKTELFDLNRKFNIDLAPKILYSRGPLVELLISSNVARYVEFKCITRILTWMRKAAENVDQGKLYVVPCSRSDVFTTDVVDLVEKRLLMKFLEFCHSYEQNREHWDEYQNKTFREFLESHKLTETLIHFVTCSIAMVDENIACLDGLKNTALFLNSLGRYGTMPFLFSLYGSGEMPQAFCRLCAVFEGTYMLRRSIDSIILDAEKKVVGVLSEGIKLGCQNLVMDASYAPSHYLPDRKKEDSISRAIFLTDRSICPCEKEQLTVMQMPAKDGNSVKVTAIEVGVGTGVCPAHTYCVHLSCRGSDAEADLRITVERLFNTQDSKDNDKPKILFSLYFNQFDLSHQDLNDKCPPNLSLCGGPGISLDYDAAINEAKDIFAKLFPTEDFLPRAPDPDEIIFDYAEGQAKAGDTFATEDLLNQGDDNEANAEDSLNQGDGNEANAEDSLNQGDGNEANAEDKAL